MTTKPQSTTEETLKLCEWCKQRPETWAEPNEPHTAAVRCANKSCPIHAAGWVSPGFWNTRLSPASTAPVVDEISRRIKALRGVAIESGNGRDQAYVEGGIAALENLLEDLPAAATAAYVEQSDRCAGPYYPTDEYAAAVDDDDD